MSKSVWIRDDFSLEEINLRGKDTLVEHLEIIVTEVGTNFLMGTMPVDKRTVQPARILHGGASCVLAESLGSIAANMVIDSKKYIAVGQSISANHLRPVPEVSIVTGKAIALHLGKKSQIWDIDITNEEGKLICSSRLTMAIIEKPTRN
ncbi:MAG: hotdog fold thioesterase [Bacteriovoracaceae bacterium]|nr:hotdog fold thioesterase [Bacteriovoracaceae bacterium]